MLKNFWYAIEFCDALKDKPIRVTVMGQELVLYRDSQGKVICLSDLCVHRGGALSGGWIKGDCVVCPYHGWEFATDGACVRIPANAASVPVPKKARVDAYPTVEKYGYIWAFLGDLPENERPPVPELPDFDNPELRPLRGDYHWNAHYARVVENSMDATHAPFVHGGAFGNPDEPEIMDYQVELGDYHGEAEIYLKPQPAKGFWRFLYKSGAEQPPVRTATAFYMPNFTKLEVQLPIGRFILYNSHLPIDDYHTVSKWTLLRSFFTQAWADKNSVQRVFKIFGQDQPVVEEQRPELLPYDIGAELHVRSDLIQIEYRRMRKTALNKGWGIDMHRINSEFSGHTAVVIPSPQRRSNPELAAAWVLGEVPTRKPAGD